jgi:hypothetical protein
LEAAILGCPVLLSDIRPNLDIGLAQDNYFKVGDIEDLRRKLAAPHETYRVDSRSIRDRYDWDKISESTSAVYSTLARTLQDGPARTLTTWFYGLNGKSPALPWGETATQAPPPLEPQVSVLPLQKQRRRSRSRLRYVPPPHRS